MSQSTAEAGELSPRDPVEGRGHRQGGTGGGKDGQHTEVGSRLHVTTTDSRTGQTRLGDGGGHRLASWTSGYATARSEAICRGAGCGRTRPSGSVGGQGQQRPWSTRPSAATVLPAFFQTCSILKRHIRRPRRCSCTTRMKAGFVSIAMSCGGKPARSAARHPGAVTVFHSPTISGNTP